MKTTQQNELNIAVESEVRDLRAANVCLSVTLDDWTDDSGLLDLLELRRMFLKWGWPLIELVSGGEDELLHGVRVTLPLLRTPEVAAMVRALELEGKAVYELEIVGPQASTLTDERTLAKSFPSVEVCRDHLMQRPSDEEGPVKLTPSGLAYVSLVDDALRVIDYAHRVASDEILREPSKREALVRSWVEGSRFHAGFDL